MGQTSKVRAGEYIEKAHNYKQIGEYTKAIECLIKVINNDDVEFSSDPSQDFYNAYSKLGLTYLELYKALMSDPSFLAEEVKMFCPENVAQLGYSSSEYFMLRLYLDDSINNFWLAFEKGRYIVDNTVAFVQSSNSEQAEKYKYSQIALDFIYKISSIVHMLIQDYRSNFEVDLKYKGKVTSVSQVAESLNNLNKQLIGINPLIEKIKPYCGVGETVAYKASIEGEVFNILYDMQMSVIGNEAI